MQALTARFVATIAPLLVAGMAFAQDAAQPVSKGLTLGAAPAPQALPALVEPPFLEKAIADGKLPPMAQRIPAAPKIVDFSAPGQEPGQYGGLLRTIGASAKDTRLLVVYGYARLVGYDSELNIVPDIAESFEVEEGRRFTFHLRPGHKWSDGAPFTSEDFRYYWEDMASNKDFQKFGVPSELLVEGEKPVVEFPDPLTVRYTWHKPNPQFLPAMAGAMPFEIFRPSHYLRKFHAKHLGKEAAEALAKKEGQRNWVTLHFLKDHSYRNDNIELPTLQPWLLKTKPPSDRYVFDRNPYYYRIGNDGKQLPYIDQVSLSISNPGLIAAKVAAGEADLQAAYLGFANYTFLKRAEQRSDYAVRRWTSGKGSRVALFPNLNTNDEQWRDLLRNVDFRRALSIAINRNDINNAIFYGMAKPGNNTVLPQSALYDEKFRTTWTQYDPDEANRMLDKLGLDKRDAEGMRLLPDGEPMQIVVETSGEDTEQSDVLELVRDDWAKIGVGLFIKPSQREVLYNRVKAGTATMSVWTGLDNAIPVGEMSPIELTPFSGEQFQWPAWGSWVESRGQLGKEPDVASVKHLIELKKEWLASGDPARRAAIWREMLQIWADEVYTIGIVSNVDQLVVVNNHLRNVPQRGTYNFEPGAFFGIYRPDTFFFDNQRNGSGAEKAS